MGLWFKRVPEEDEQVDFTLGDLRAHLLIAPQWTTHQGLDGDTELAAKTSTGRSGGEEGVLGEHGLIVAGPRDEVCLAIVMRDEHDSTSGLHRR